MSVPFDPAAVAEFQPARRLPYDVQAINATPDGGLEITYVNPDQDVKTIGAILVHSLLVPATEDYAENIDAVLGAASFLVADVLQDWDDLEPLPKE